MRNAWLVVLAACGGSPKAAAPMPAATAVATSDPAPAAPGVAPDPCEGGEVTPTSGGLATGGEGGVIGHGAGTGQGGGNPCGDGMRNRGPVVQLDGATVTGPLDKAIIRRYMKRNINRIQYCYEQQLMSHPRLAGTVTATFEIGVDGLVTNSRATGLADVDTCIAGVIKAIEFPKPQAPTKVVYPFVFH